MYRAGAAVVSTINSFIKKFDRTKSAIVGFWHELDSTAKKTHPRVTTDQQT